MFVASNARQFTRLFLQLLACTRIARSTKTNVPTYAWSTGANVHTLNIIEGPNLHGVRSRMKVFVCDVVSPHQGRVHRDREVSIRLLEKEVPLENVSF